MFFFKKKREENKLDADNDRKFDFMSAYALYNLMHRF